MAKSYSPEQAIGRVKRFVFIGCILISSLPYIVVTSQVYYTQLWVTPVCKYPGLKILGLWKYPPSGIVEKRGVTATAPLPLASLRQDRMTSRLVTRWRIRLPLRYRVLR